MQTVLENSKRTFENIHSYSYPINMLKGVIISIILTLLFLFIFANVLTYTNISECTISPVIITITAISILIGSSLATIKIKKNGVINGALLGFIYISIIYMISSISKTGFILNFSSLIMMCISLISGAIGGIVGVNLK